MRRPELPQPDDAAEMASALAEARHDDEYGGGAFEELPPRRQRKMATRERAIYVEAWQRIHTVEPKGGDPR